jgi:hypothetical protein
VKTLESKETKASKEITVTHNSVFAAHRLQCRMTNRKKRHPAFCLEPILSTCSSQTSSITFIGFIIVHIGLVIAHGFGREMAKIVLGDEASSHALATIIGLLAIAAVIAFHICGTWYSLVSPSQAKRLLEIG